MEYDDPVTVPAADIAENPYWKRDVRRRYAQTSRVTQADAVALLEVGSAAQPKQELIGEAGSKQLVAAKEEGVNGLAVAFEKNTALAKDVLGPGGMPPLPSGLHVNGDGKKRYDLEQEQSYGDGYVVSLGPHFRNPSLIHVATHAGHLRKNIIEVQHPGEPMPHVNMSMRFPCVQTMPLWLSRVVLFFIYRVLMLCPVISSLVASCPMGPASTATSGLLCLLEPQCAKTRTLREP